MVDTRKAEGQGWNLMVSRDRMVLYLEQAAMAELGDGASAEQIEAVRVRVLGRGGELTDVMRRPTKAAANSAADDTCGEIDSPAITELWPQAGVALFRTGLTLETGVTDALNLPRRTQQAGRGYQWQQTQPRSARSGS